jgi:hypothetical protein
MKGSGYLTKNGKNDKFGKKIQTLFDRKVGKWKTDRKRLTFPSTVGSQCSAVGESTHWLRKSRIAMFQTNALSSGKACAYKHSVWEAAIARTPS